MGYPINTVNDDIFITLTPDGKRAYLSSFREGGFGNMDIYMILLEIEEKPVSVIKGEVITCEKENADVEITVFDSENDDLLGLYRPNSRTGKYLFILPRGRSYYAIYEVNGKKRHQEDFFISDSSGFQVIYKTISLVKESPCEEILAVNESETSTNKDLYTLWKCNRTNYCP